MKSVSEDLRVTFSASAGAKTLFVRILMLFRRPLEPERVEHTFNFLHPDQKSWDDSCADIIMYKNIPNMSENHFITTLTPEIQRDSGDVPSTSINTDLVNY